MKTTRFTKRVRLLNAAQFDAAFKRGKRVHSGSFIAVLAPSELGYPRLGFALSKRNAPLSVHRNRLRRLFREHFRLHQDELAPVDMVLMLKSRAPTEPAEMVVEVNAVWQKVFERCQS
jgi:ribonuclease P protein component